MAWFLSKSNDSGIVMTSRIRLARNIDGIPYPHMLSEAESKKVVEDVYNAVRSSSMPQARELRLVTLKELGNLNMLSMAESHVISPDLVNNYEKAAVLIDKDESVAIMLNEEDHIRLQVMYPGLRLKEAYEYASRLDDAIEENITYAYDSKLGYLTSCPTNVGTGIRASVMLHLPGLTYTRNINNILSTVNQVGMTIRGLYGEGSNAMGNMYQISNQVTLGLSEEDIINNLQAVTKKITDQEEKAREIMHQKRGIDFEDDIYRSLGILKYSRVMESNECLNLISKVRMGIEMGIIKDVDIRKLNELITIVQPATLQLIEGKELDSKGRDAARARVVREALK